MKNITAQPYRSSKISPEERDAARRSINAFSELLSRLDGARSRDLQVVSVLQKNQDASPNDLFKIRHLLRKFQEEVRDRYTKIIIAFAGKKNKDMKSVTEGYIHNLIPLEHDTITREIKENLLDAMQQLTEFVEEFLGLFNDFNNPDQIKNIISTSKKEDTIIQSIKNVVEKQLKLHFEKNILRNKISDLRGGIIKRARIIRLLENE